MKKLSAGALEVLSTRLSYRDETVKISGALPRALYLEVNAALETLGAKWDKKWKAHVFSGKSEAGIREAIRLTVNAAGFVDKKKELQQFFTPRDIADLLVKLADIQAGMTVLEPSAGNGMLAKAVMNGWTAHNAPQLTLVEIDEENVKQLNSYFISSASRIIHANFLTMVPSPTGRTTTTHLPGGLFAGFDRIVMNPPFTKHADVEHVTHAFKFLKHGGRLVSVMSSHVTFADDSTCREFREFAKENGSSKALMAAGCLVTLCDGAPFYLLPSKAFASSGTNVSTVAIVLERPR